MLDQSIVNTLITIVAGVFGWVLKVLWDAVKELQRSDKELNAAVNELEVLVAGDYVKREELREEFKRLFVKLDTIEQKLDQKADK